MLRLILLAMLEGTGLVVLSVLGRPRRGWLVVFVIGVCVLACGLGGLVVWLA